MEYRLRKIDPIAAENPPLRQAQGPGRGGFAAKSGTAANYKNAQFSSKNKTTPGLHPDLPIIT